MTDKIGKEKAIKLRKEGKSIRDIENILGNSRSTISYWVKNVNLTKKQELELKRKHKENSLKNVQKFNQKRRDLKIDWRKDGKEIYKRYKNDPVFMFGLGLYWGEGNKGGKTLGLINSDKQILLQFISFISKYLNIKKDDLNFTIYYPGILEKPSNLESYWIEGIKLKEKNYKNTYSSKGTKDGKGYGCCRVYLSRVEYAQKILGMLDMVY